MLHGCSDTVPVRGTVKREGRAVSGGTVMFRPVGRGKPAYGAIQRDGSFTLSTNNEGDGAVEGEYRVTVTGEHDPDIEETSATYVGPREKIYTVVSGAETDFTIEIREEDGWRAVLNDD